MTDRIRGHNSLRVGFFGIAGVLAFSAMFIYSTNRTLGAHRSTVFVRLAAADGLQKGDAVLLKGVKVGEIRSIDFLAGEVIVRARLLREVPLTRAATAAMVPADMFGRQTVVLYEGDGVGRPLMDGDTVAGSSPVSITGRIEAIGQQVDALVSDSTISAVLNLLGGAGAAAADASSATQAIERLAGRADRILDEQRTRLDDITRELGQMAANLREATEPSEIERLTDRIDSTTVSLQAAAASVDAITSAIALLVEDLRAGRGSAGKLLQDDALYERTVGVLSAFERLADDIRENPKRYLNFSVF